MDELPSPANNDPRGHPKSMSVRPRSDLIQAAGLSASETRFAALERNDLPLRPEAAGLGAAPQLFFVDAVTPVPLERLYSRVAVLIQGFGIKGHCTMMLRPSGICNVAPAIVISVLIGGRAEKLTLVVGETSNYHYKDGGNARTSRKGCLGLPYLAPFTGIVDSVAFAGQEGDPTKNGLPWPRRALN